MHSQFLRSVNKTGWSLLYFVLMGVHGIAGSAHAAIANKVWGDSGETKIKAELKDDFGQPGLPLSIPVHLDIKWKVSLLMGEPTVLCTATWRLDKDDLTSRRLSAKLREGGVPFGDPEDEKLFTIYDLKLIANVKSEALKYRIPWILRCDAGIPGSPYTRPFNVTGSPDWDQLFELGWNSEGKKKVSAADAKEVFRGGFQLEGWRVERAQMNLSELLAKYARRDAKAQLIKTRSAAIDEYANALAGAYEIPEAKLRQQLHAEIDGKNSLDEKFDAVTRQLERLRSGALPKPIDDPERQRLYIERTRKIAAHNAELESKALADLKRFISQSEQRKKEFEDRYARYQEDINARARKTGNVDWFAFDSGKLWGYKDGQGSVVLEPNYISAKDFSYGYACVELKSREYWYINTLGERIAGPYSRCDYFNENGVALAAQEYQQPGRRYLLDRWFLIDQSGKKIAGDFEEIQQSSPKEPYFVVRQQRGVGGWFVIDSQGKRLLGPYADATGFSDGLVGVQPVKYRPWRYVDITGNQHLEDLDHAGTFKDGLAIVNTLKERRCVLTREGKNLGCYWDTPSIGRGYFAVPLGDSYFRVMDKNGKIIIDENVKNLTRHERIIARGDDVYFYLRVCSSSKCYDHGIFHYVWDAHGKKLLDRYKGSYELPSDFLEKILSK